MLKILWGISDYDRQNSNFFAHSSYLPQMSLLAGLPESSGERVRNYPQQASSSPWLSMLTYHPGTSNRSADDRSSETWSHPIIINHISILMHIRFCMNLIILLCCTNKVSIALC
jgi:hypothetical protein